MSYQQVPISILRNHFQHTSPSKTMRALAMFVGKFQYPNSYIPAKLSSFSKLGGDCAMCFYRFFQSNLCLLQLIYFISISFAGFLALKILKPINETNSPNGLDLFFTAVSALTVSSMGTVEMEDFSNSQLWVLIILMLIGGEVFTSMIGLQFTKLRLEKENPTNRRSKSVYKDIESADSVNFYRLKHEAITYLGYVVLGYLILVNVSGSLLISLYLNLASNAGDVLRSKGIEISTFSIFTAVSSFGNCGFTPVNENMMPFKNNSALLLLIIPQILAGNTLFPPFLRFAIWVSRKFTRREGYDYILQHPSATRYKHLLSHRQSVYLTSTVLSFILVQSVFFCALEWNSDGMAGMSSYQKIAAALFQSVNSRHAGESVVDLSTLSSAVLVLYAAMMYLPPCTSFLPVSVEEQASDDGKEDNCKSNRTVDNLVFSQISYLVIFVVLICITERQAMSADPLNFNVFNIVFEVVSAYGNVGYSFGYSCKRLPKRDTYCRDFSYGFVGKWSAKGKLILILVMFFGRLKKFNMEGGKAWRLC